MKKLLQNLQQDGSTLVESLISVVFLMTGSIGLIGMQVNVMNTSAVTNQSNYALEIAREKLEALRNFSSLVAYSNIADSSDTVSGVNASYTRSWSVTTITSPPYKKIVVTVSWTSAQNETETVSVVSNIARIDPIQSGNSIAPVVTFP